MRSKMHTIPTATGAKPKVRMIAANLVFFLLIA